MLRRVMAPPRRGGGGGGGSAGGGGGTGGVAQAPRLDFEARTGVDAGRPRVSGVAHLGAAGAALVSEGTPEGFGAEGTSSWFDRLWASRAKQRRFYIHLVRPKR